MFRGESVPLSEKRTFQLAAEWLAGSVRIAAHSCMDGRLLLTPGSAPHTPLWG